MRQRQYDVRSVTRFYAALDLENSGNQSTTSHSATPEWFRRNERDAPHNDRS